MWRRKRRQTLLVQRLRQRGFVIDQNGTVWYEDQKVGRLVNKGNAFQYPWEARSLPPIKEVRDIVRELNLTTFGVSGEPNTGESR